MDLAAMSNPTTRDMNDTTIFRVLVRAASFPRPSPIGPDRTSSAKENPNAVLGHINKRPQMKSLHQIHIFIWINLQSI